MLAHLLTPIAVASFATAISIIGVLATFAWLAWRFGPALTRLAGWCSWWVAWACGSQGGYAECVVLLLVGTLAWAGGTIWYAKRRGRWPSSLSARLFTRLLGRRSPVMHIDHSPFVVVPRRRR